MEEDNGIIWISSVEVRDGNQSYRSWEDELLNIHGIDVLFAEKKVSVLGKVPESELVKIVNELE